MLLEFRRVLFRSVTIRNMLLSPLASTSKNVRRGAAQAVAAVASIDLPRNEWHEILTSLIQNAQSTTANFKMSALETLGYICEEIGKSVLSEAEVNSVLSAIVGRGLAASEPSEIKLVALMALNGVIPFCEKNFTVESERNLQIGRAHV